MGQHQWSDEDEIVGLFLYRFGEDSLPWTIEAISDLLGMSASSMRMKIGNFQFVDTGGKKGLAGVSEACKRIYAEHGKTPRDELEPIVRQHIGEAEQTANAEPEPEPQKQPSNGSAWTALCGFAAGVAASVVTVFVWKSRK